MGLLDKLKGTGVLTSAKPEQGVEPQPPEEVARRLTEISGDGIETEQQGDEIVVSWGAKVKSAGGASASYRYAYRAIRVRLDAAERIAKGLCLKTTADGRIRGTSFSGGAEWERGQHVGMETFQVVALLGPHETERGADEGGYMFKWSTLRDPVIEAVTGAGWTYKPEKV